MNGHWKDVDLDDAVAGMELACDLADHQGTVLLQQGAVLTETLLSALARRGVERLRVLGEPADAAELEAGRARVQERLAHLFRRGEAGPAALLRSQLQAYREESL